MSDHHHHVDFYESWKRKVNLAGWVATAHQRGIIIPFRNKFGTQALGIPCALAVVMMFLWWMLSRDEGMMWWMCFWFVCFAIRRVEALRLRTKIHSHFDGLTINLGNNERRAKLIYEPALIGVLAFIVTKFYEAQGWPLYGLPWFLWFGVFSLSFVAAMQQKAWDKTLEGMRDAEEENKARLKGFRDRYGH